MAGFTLTEWIAAPLATVFEETIGTKNAEAIMSNFVSMEQMTDGDIGVGTRFVETRMMNGKSATAELTVTGFERPDYYAVSNETSGVQVTYHYRFSAENDGTRINLEAAVSGSGIKKLIVPIVVGVLKKEDDTHLTKLKAIVEGKS